MSENLHDAIANAPCVRFPDREDCVLRGQVMKHPECAAAAALKWFAEAQERAKRRAEAVQALRTKENP